MITESLGALITWETIIFCLSLFALVFLVRKLCEGFWSSLLTNRFWNEGFLSVATILFGILLAIVPATSLFFPEVIAGSTFDRCIFASVSGLFSSFIYNRVKNWIKTGKDTPDQNKTDGSDEVVTGPGSITPE